MRSITPEAGQEQQDQEQEQRQRHSVEEVSTMAQLLRATALMGSEVAAQVLGVQGREIQQVTGALASSSSAFRSNEVYP